MAADIDANGERMREGWVSRWTTLPSAARNLFDPPTTGLDAWARTTSSVVAFLLALQMLTGVLLAFYFVPSVESAHATVEYVEKVVACGSWIRALHFYGSQFLTVALLLHLLQMFLRGSYRRRPIGWLAAIALLALVMANGATGFSLPWDARAFFSTRIAAGLAGGLPLAAGAARAWLLAGTDLSTLTLSRLYALHVLVVPLLMLIVAVARVFIFRDTPATKQETTGLTVIADESRRAFMRGQIARGSIVIALVFLVLALVSWKYPAPLGPRAGDEATGYLPRPGAQFLWLFQLLKYFPSGAASLVATLLPALLLSTLALLPFLHGSKLGRFSPLSPRKLGASVFVICFLLVAGLTAAAYIEDARDPRVGAQLAKQAAEETEFRNAPFAPILLSTNPGRPVAEQAISGQAAQPDGSSDDANAQASPPDAYTVNCAKCHGANGEGRSINPPLVGVSKRPDRTVEDIVAILKNPRAYNLDKRMPSFTGKLSEDEMQMVAEWIVSLR